MSVTASSIPSRLTELVSIALLAVLLGSVPAWAGGDSHAQAKASFDRAQAQFEKGHYRSALEGYRQAYALAPLPAILYDIAQCERKLHRWSDAERDYRKFLKDAPDSPQRPVVLSLIEEMHAKAELASLQRQRRRGADAAPAKDDGASGPEVAQAAPPTPEPPAASTAPATSSAGAEAKAPPSPVAPVAPVLTPSAPPPSSAVTALAQAPAASPSTPVYKKWWFWGGVAAVAAGTATAIAIASHGGPASTSLGEVSLR